MRKILIVEDEPVLRDVYQTIISSQPYICHVAANGEEALEKCKDQTYDLILLDIMMPVMDGIEFLEHYTQLEGPKSKVIILSNLSAGKEIDRAYELGVVKNLVKSDISPKQLIAAIRYDLEASSD